MLYAFLSYVMIACVEVDFVLCLVCYSMDRDSQPTRHGRCTQAARSPTPPPPPSPPPAFPVPPADQNQLFALVTNMMNMMQQQQQQNQQFLIQQQ